MSGPLDDIKKAGAFGRGKAAQRYLLANPSIPIARPIPAGDAREGITLRPIGSLFVGINMMNVGVVREPMDRLLHLIEPLIAGEKSLSAMWAKEMGNIEDETTPNTGTSSSNPSVADALFLINSDKYDGGAEEYSLLVYTLEHPDYVDKRVVAAMRKMIEKGGFSIYNSCLHHNTGDSKHAFLSATDICTVDGTQFDEVADWDPEQPPCKLVAWCITELTDAPPRLIIWGNKWGHGPLEHIGGQGKTAVAGTLTMTGAEADTSAHNDHIHIDWEQGDRPKISQAEIDALPQYTRETARTKAEEIDISFDGDGDDHVDKSGKIGVTVHFTDGVMDQTAAEINEYHKSRGFTPKGSYPLKHIGYNAIVRYYQDTALSSDPNVDPDSAYITQVQEGRDPSVIGCHAKSPPGEPGKHNRVYLGIALCGRDEDANFPVKEQVYQAAKQICRWKFDDGFENLLITEVNGHRQLPGQDPDTICPGHNVVNRFNIGAFIDTILPEKYGYSTYRLEGLDPNDFMFWFRQLVLAISAFEYNQGPINWVPSDWGLDAWDVVYTR